MLARARKYPVTWSGVALEYRDLNLHGVVIMALLAASWTDVADARCTPWSGNRGKPLIRADYLAPGRRTDLRSVHDAAVLDLARRAGLRCDRLVSADRRTPD
jgi:hypothetical protein